jgi:hypothetical protein
VQRLRGGLNRRPHRLFGILKTESEFVGAVAEDSGAFEFWERRAHAVHATGWLRGRRGGTRLELTFVVTGRTLVLLVIFAVLYVAAAYGVTVRSADPIEPKLPIWIAGAIAITAIFAIGARNQRAALRSFIERLFGDVEEQGGP